MDFIIVRPFSQANGLRVIRVDEAISEEAIYV